MWAHAYQFDEDTATFIVECSEDTWSAWGFGDMTQDESIRVCERIFGKYLGGNRLVSNARHLRGSAWLNFNRVLCERWSHKNLCCWATPPPRPLFQRSGTKLAWESANLLADLVNGGAAWRRRSPL